MRFCAILSFLILQLFAAPFALADTAASISVGMLSYVGKEPTPAPSGKSTAAVTVSAGGLSYAGKEPTPTPDGKSTAAITLHVGGLSYTGGIQQPEAKPLSVPLQKNEAQPEKNMGQTQPTSQTKKAPTPTKRDGRVLSFKLLSYKPLGGTNPFSVKDVSRLDQAPKLTSPERSTESGTLTPVASPTTPHAPDNSPPPAIVTRNAAPTSFTCAGKPDGNYCKDSNTQVFCYKDNLMNSQNCPSGCNETTNSCNAYKP